MSSPPHLNDSGQSSAHPRPSSPPSSSVTQSRQEPIHPPPPMDTSSSSSTASPPNSDSIPTPVEAPQFPSPPTTSTEQPNRIPWQGSIPSFFIVGPNGQLIPHFPVLPPQPHNTSGDQNTATPQPPASSLPGGQPFDLANMGIPGNGRTPFGRMFTFFMDVPGMHAEPPADPEAAAELLRSLPTVDKGLFKRVERIVLAEQQVNDEEEDGKGWTCGICLEGVDEDAKTTGIKALPCNHLFHGDCLEPWFASHYTCPTCRMDLDPMKTLRSNSPRSSRRPAQTGAGRPSPHPYTRPGGPNLPSTTEQDNQNTAQPQMEPEITFIWQMPAPGLPAHSPSNQPTQSTQETSTAHSSSETSFPPLGVHAETPGTPTQAFDVPLHASPLPMTRSASAPSPSPPTPATLPTPPGGSERPQPQRRSHIHFIHHHHPHPPHEHSPHHHHHLRLPGMPSSIMPPGPMAPNAIPSVGIAPPSGIGGNAPQLSFFINFSNNPAPPFVPRMPSPAPSHADASNQTAEAPAAQPAAMADDAISLNPAPQPIVRQSLDSWVASRERALGWRCDAPVCSLAPAEEDDLVMPTEGEKDMLSIYSNLQAVEMLSKESGYELHACEHRWHRFCLELSQRSAGRSFTNDADGRVWVRCERCRKDGWVREEPRKGSEGDEVERLVAQ